MMVKLVGSSLLLIHKSVKTFVYSFCFDAPDTWTELPDKIRASSCLSAFSMSNLFVKHTYQSLLFNHVSPDNDLLPYPWI